MEFCKQFSRSFRLRNWYIFLYIYWNWYVRRNINIYFGLSTFREAYLPTSSIGCSWVKCILSKLWCLQYLSMIARNVLTLWSVTLPSTNDCRNGCVMSVCILRGSNDSLSSDGGNWRCSDVGVVPIHKYISNLLMVFIDRILK